jgi:ketosteroid isomerase-like protein
VWRAEILAHVAGAAGVKAIYHSDTRRTRQTAEPLAKELGLTPIIYPPKENDTLVTRIFAEHEGETVLVVGHSNTVSTIIAAAGGPKIGDLPEDEFDKLFVVVMPPCRRGASTLVTLQYGAPSPRPATSEVPEPAPQPSVELPPELARVLTDYEVAWRNKDENALADLFAEDGFVLSGGTPPVRGRSAIKQQYKDAGGALSLRALAWSTDGDTGYIIGAFSRAKGEKDVGKFTLTLVEENGRWLIMSDMDNSNRR